MKSYKISLIGAGSGCFSLGVIRDLCRSEVLSNCHVSLMDINVARLDAIYDICVRYNKEIGGQLTFDKTTDRVESLKGADFVISTALTAPHSRLKEGFEIAKKWGFKFGGSYHVMYDEAFWINFYQLRFMEDLTKDILEYCPEAWHLMVENPMVAGVTLLKRKYPEAKTIGLCHGFADTYDMVEAMGYKKEDVTFQMPGVNHFVWLNEARIKGEPFFPILDKWIEEHGEEHWKTCYISSVFSKKRLDFYKKHGVLGIGDTLSWTGASWPWWYHTSDELEKEYTEYHPENGWNWYFDLVEKTANDFIALSKDPDAKVTDFLSNVGEDVLIIPLVESIAGNIPRIHIINTINKGQLVPGLPEDFEVEVPALCSADGIYPITTKPLPKHMIAHILRDRVAPVEMELAAYESGDLYLLKELVLMDKWAQSMEQVEGFISEIMDLPYHTEMKEHYKIKNPGL